MNLLSIAVTAIESDVDTLGCFDLLKVLRPHLEDPDAMLAQVARQREGGYRLLAAKVDGRIAGLARYRHQENLVHGGFVYVDDLVVDEARRKLSVGRLLLTFITDEAMAQGSGRLVLDTALTNTGAQHFYFNAGLEPVAFHSTRTPQQAGLPPAGRGS